MVKSYDRYEQEKCFGVIASQSNIVWLPSTTSQTSKSMGRAMTSGLEEILIWDIKTGEIIHRLRDGLTPGASNAPTASAPSPITYLVYHEATNIVAAGHQDGSIKVWDLTSTSVILTFQGHKSSISLLKFDRTGTRLVSGSSDSSIIMWDLVSEEGLYKFKGHKGQITGMSFLTDNPDHLNDDDMEDYLLTTSKDGLIKLWELKSQQCIETHLAHTNECWSMGINKDRDMVITTGNKDQVKIWTIDLSKPDQQKILERGLFEKTSKARCNDTQFKTVKDINLFSLQNADRSIEIFRIRSDEEIKKAITKRTKRLLEKGYDEDEILKSISESDISMLITPFTTLRVMSKIRSCTWISNSNKKLDLLISLTNNTIECHNIPIPDQIKKIQPNDIHSIKNHSIDLLGHKTDIRAMDISSDSKLLATASNGELKIWNIKTNNVIRSFELESGYALCCKFLPGDTLIALGFKNGNLELYDLATSSLIDRVEKAHNSSTTLNSEEDGSAIWSMDITSDGKTLVTGGNDKSVKFWNFKIELEILPGSSTKISSLKFKHSRTLELNDDILCVKISSDCKYLAISLLNNNVNVVFFDSLKLFLTLYGHKLPVLSIDISYDSKLIITSSADKNIKIWGLDFGDCHKSIFGHQDSIMNVKFIGESHNFFSSGKDGLIKYWDGDKFECIQKLPGHQSEVWCIALSRDGLFMISTSHDHSIRLWVATDDQVFLEEEREKEMDELYENELIDSIENDEEKDNNDDNEDGVGQVKKQTMETLKAGERLMEALDIGIEDVEATKEYNRQLKYDKANAIKPTANSILIAYSMTGPQYVLSVINKIKSAQLDDALLVLPFSYTLKLLKFIEIWTNEENIKTNITSLSMISKILLFIIKSNARELINQRDVQIKNQLISVKQQLRQELNKMVQQLGINTQGLKYVKQQWKLHHELQFIDQDEQDKYLNDKDEVKKRTFTTI
jgi:U3 small nucleolar RNA-associated protein 12